MPPWDKHDAFQSLVINMSLQQVSDYENNNKYRKNPKIH